MAILKAGKLEHGCQSQKLVSSLSRGGLWNINKYAQNIFLKTEHQFRYFTSGNCLKKVDIAGITLKSVMVSDAELIPEGEVSKNVLHAIVSLYIRVRSFSCAKDIIQHFKVNAKQTKAKALRTEIMRTHDQEQARPE